MTTATTDNWKDQLVNDLKSRDDFEGLRSETFDNFSLLNQRVVIAESLLQRLRSVDIQSDLEKALHEKEGLEEQLKVRNNNTKELEKVVKDLKSENIKSKKEVFKLNRIVSNLTNKLNNQSEEYQHKNKSIELLNDEFLSLQIQNNLLYDKVEKLEKENESLVARWIEKVQFDADKINDANLLYDQMKKSNESNT